MAARNMEKRETQIFRVIREVEKKVKCLHTHFKDPSTKRNNSECHTAKREVEKSKMAATTPGKNVKRVYLDLNMR